MPKDLRARRKGDVDYRSSKVGLLALMWTDHSNVSMLSIVHTAVMDGDNLLVVKNYNISMECVHVGDQMASCSLTTPPVQGLVQEGLLPL